MRLFNSSRDCRINSVDREYKTTLGTYNILGSCWVLVISARDIIGILTNDKNRRVSKSQTKITLKGSMIQNGELLTICINLNT